MWLLFSLSTALLLATLSAFSFVGVLYVWRPSAALRADRDHPAVIKQRVAATGLLCLVAPLFLWLLRWTPPPAAQAELGPGPPLREWLGFPSHSYGAGLTAPLLLTASLFMGPVLMQVLEAVHYGQMTGQGLAGAVESAWSSFSSHWAPFHRWQSLRNLVAAPITEELVFRGVVLALLVAGGWGFRACVLLSPALFGLAHGHHLLMLVRARGVSLQRAAAMVAFQLAYTSLFGAYAAALLLRTGHMTGVILAHAWCNLLGVPQLGFLSPGHVLFPKRRAILAVFVAGIVVFSLALVPLTDDQWLYNSSGQADADYTPKHNGSWLLHYQRMHQQGDMSQYS